MKLCFIADANSIHARNWIAYFCKPGNEVHVLSTVRGPLPIAGASVHDLHSGKIVTDGGMAGRPLPADNFAVRAVKRLYETQLFEWGYLLYQTYRLTGAARKIVGELRPDILHCLRLPIEGYIGGRVGYRPLVISSWGDDFVFFAAKYLPFRRLTRTALARADAHFADNIRDRSLAGAYGFAASKTTAAVPGWGGLKISDLPPHDVSFRTKMDVSPETNLLISPRGFGSAFVNTAALVRALPRVVERFPDTLCLLLGDMRSAGYLGLKKLAGKLGIEPSCRFVHRLPHQEFLNYMAASDLAVSVSLYDGCAVSTIEAMACGAIPVVSDDAPKREWVTDGSNGYLFNPRRTESIAGAIIKALENRGGFEAMRQKNRRIVEERADYYKNMKVAEEIYRKLLQTPSGTRG